MSGLFGELDAPPMRGFAHEAPVSDSEVWLTPPWLLERLGPFDLDPCACMEPRPWPTAARHYTRRENGLRQAWRGRVWCNPPYGPPAVIDPWVRRMAGHGRGTLLIFARVETALWQDVIWPRCAAVLFPRGRLRFCRPDGTQSAINATAPSALVAFGIDDARRLRASGIAGALVAQLDEVSA